MDAGECPLWVKSGHCIRQTRCLLYPQKRTWPGDSSMSALCQKQTHALQQSILGLGQVLPDFCQQLTWAERLWNVIIAARLAGLLLLSTERIRRNRDNLD
jgi:hypothetical protein